MIGRHVNPVTGPLWIEGAKPGDTLAVRIETIETAREWGVSCLLPGCGALTWDPHAPSLHPPLPERVWLWRRTASGGFAWRDRWEVPWTPFFGVIGVVPEIATLSSETAGSRGGNLDVPDVAPGNTLYLPVAQAEALFGVGDAHAAQGQGELGGPAIEIGARGVFTFDLIKGRSIAGPRIASAGSIMTIGSGRPLEGAARMAAHGLVHWPTEEHGFEPLDAYRLLTQVGGLTIANMVNSAYSVVASCPTRYLRPEQGAADGSLGGARRGPTRGGDATGDPRGHSVGRPRRRRPERRTPSWRRPNGRGNRPRGSKGPWK